MVVPKRARKKRLLRKGAVTVVHLGIAVIYSYNFIGCMYDSERFFQLPVLSQQ